MLLDPSSPDYQHSPSTSHCSSNHNPPSSMQSNSLAGASLYDKVSTLNSTANTMGDSGNNQRSLLATSKPNLRSFTVPVAPPLIPPPPLVNHKQPTSGASASSQCMSTCLVRHSHSLLHVPFRSDKSPFRSPNRTMLNHYSKEIKSMANDSTDASPADVLEDVRNQLGNLMKKDFQC